MKQTVQHVIAYCVEDDKEYRLDLHPYGVRPHWPNSSIRSVAKREMLNVWKKRPTNWKIEDVEDF